MIADFLLTAQPQNILIPSCRFPILVLFIKASESAVERYVGGIGYGGRYGCVRRRVGGGSDMAYAMLSVCEIVCD